MKALVYSGPKKITFKNVPEPEAYLDDILVKIDAVGICGSDMHAYMGHDERRPAPLILGHEASGEVLEGALKGKKVVINPLVTCGVCRACLSGRSNLCPYREIISMPPRQGAFAEKIRIPERNILQVPESLGIHLAALAEPLATSWHAIVLAGRHMNRPISESDALVIGSGAVGLGAALVLRAFGCSRVMVAETNSLRRSTAEKAGFNDTLDPSEDIKKPNKMVDLVIDAVGNKHTRKFAINRVNPGGVIVHIGLGDGEDGLDARKLTLQEVALVGSYTYTPMDFSSTLDAMAAGRLGSLDWAEIRKLEDGPAAFEDLLAGRASAAKIILSN